MSDFSLYIDAQTIDDAAKESVRDLMLPSPEDNDTVRIGAEPDLGTWMELLKIVDTSESAPKNDPGSKTTRVFKAVCEPLGPSEGGWAGNVGKAYYYNVYIDKEALKPGHDMYRQTMRRVNVMNSLYAALGGDAKAGYDPKALFGGEDKPLVGLMVKAVLRKSRYKTKSGEIKSPVDVDGFLPA